MATPEEKLLAAGIVTGEKRGRLLAIAAILEAQAAAIITEQYSQIASAIAAGGIIAGSKALAEGLKGTWAGMWRVGLGGILLQVMDMAELDTDQGTYQPPFNVTRPGFGEFLESYLDNLGNLLNETTRDNISEVLEEAKREGYSVDKTAQMIREGASDVSKSRAEFIARNELLRASRAGSFAKAKLSGVVSGKTWMHSYQPNPREHHLAQDGTTVGMDDRFPDGSMYPGDEDSNDGGYNCRCALKYKLDPQLLGGRE